MGDLRNKFGKLEQEARILAIQCQMVQSATTLRKGIDDSAGAGPAPASSVSI